MREIYTQEEYSHHRKAVHELLPKSVIRLKNRGENGRKKKVMNRIVGSPVVNKEFEHSPPKERNLRRILDKFF
jgi:hypothetical protein